MTILRTEPMCEVMGFANGVRDIHLTPKDTLPEVIRKVRFAGGGSTNCAAILNHAYAKKWPVDLFVLITDNQTNDHRSAQPSELLKKFRERSGRDTKMAVLGVTATDCSIADPKDPGMLDIAGFDSSFPKILAEFAKGF